MRRIIGILLIIMVMLPAAVPVSAAPDDAGETVFDAYGLEDKGIIRKYEDTFNNADIRLVMSGQDMDYIPLLRDFDFNSLDLVIEFPDSKSYEGMKTMKSLIFPDNTVSVTVLCDGSPVMSDTDFMNNLIICLWVCCPEALINDSPVQAAARELLKNNSEGLPELYETNARLNLLFDKAMKGELETSQDDLEFELELIFMIYDDISICSAESVAADEPFYSVPSPWLAENYDEAATAVFIFPVTSVTGTYANGGKAVCTYTRVCVVDLDTMEMYETYTAVRNDPPESIEITNEDGVYSSEGAAGEYAPKEALNQILMSGRVIEKKKDEKQDGKSADGEDELKESEQPGTGDADSAATQTEPADADRKQEGAADDSTSSQQGKEKNDDKGGRDVPAGKKPADSVINISEWLTQDVIYRILAILDDEMYNGAYELLRKVKDPISGNRGDLVRYIQETLIAAGQDIKADAVLGSATLSAVNGILNAFGISRVNSISSKTYSLLLTAVLLNTDEDAARTLLRDIFADWESAYNYMRGCLLYSQHRYYEARTAFDESKCADYEDRIQSCVQDMPATGQIYKNSDLSGTDSSLTVQINGNDELAATCIMIYDENENLAASLLIRGSGSAAAFLKAGKYRVQSGTGYRWYGLKDMFGAEADYEEIIFDDGMSRIELQKGYDYTIIYNARQHSEASLNLGSEDISWEDIRFDEEQ